VAKTAGIEFAELQAATAALTTTGQKASVAQTQLRQAILSIQAPTKDMANILEILGVESGATLLKNEGLVMSMKMIKEAAEGDVEVLKKAFGSVEALGAALSLTGEQGDDFTAIMSQMEDASGTLDTAFKKQNQTFDAQYQILKNNLSVVLVEIGESILPELSGSTQVVNSFLSENKEIITALSSVVRGLIIVIKESISAVFNLGKAIGHVIVFLEEFATDTVPKTMKIVQEEITNMLLTVSSSWTNTWQGIFNFFDITVLKIKKGVLDMVGFVVDQINRLISKINSLPGVSINPIGKIDTSGLAEQIAQIEQLGSSDAEGPLQPFAKGGIVTRPTRALIGEAGPEAVIPLSSSRAAGFGQTIINITVQGSVITEQELTRSVSNAISDQAYSFS